MFNIFFDGWYKELDTEARTATNELMFGRIKADAFVERIQKRADAIKKDDSPSPSSSADRSVGIMRHGKYPFVVGFLAAPVVLYVVFVIAPYVQAFQISMTNWKGLSSPQWIGLDNYRRLLDDDRFWQAIQHHGVLLLALPLITIAIALFFAFLLNVGGKSGAGSGPGSGGRSSTGWCSSSPRSWPWPSSRCCSRPCTGRTSRA